MNSAYTLGRLYVGWRLKLPLLIRLREFKNGKLPDPVAHFASLDPSLPAAPDGFFEKVLGDGMAMFLIDGVDEIPARARATLARQIKDWAQRYPTCHFIITGRPDAVPAQWPGELEFKRALVPDLTPADRNTFIDHWHRAVSKQLCGSGKLDNTEQKAADLKKQLESNPSVARMMTNPLLAATICALHLTVGRTLPTNEWEVCDDLVKMLFHLRIEHDPSMTEDRSEWSAYDMLGDSQDKRPILSSIAFEMLESGASSLPLKNMDGIVADHLAAHARISDVPPEDLRREFVTLCGLLRPGRGDGIEFIHNTLKEFLAGERYAALEVRHLKDLAKKATDPVWQPVLRFTALSLAQNQDHLNQFLRAILTSFPQPTARQRKVRATSRAAHLLLVQIASVVGMDRAIRKEIDALRDAFLPPRTLSDGQGISVCGESAIPYLRESKNPNPAVRAACVRALGSMELADANKELDAFEEDPEGTVLAELARYRNPLAFPKVQEALIQTGEIPEWCPREFIRDLEPLRSLGWKLTLLDCSETQVSDLSPLRELTQIKLLSCGGTQVRDLSPVRGLTQLTALYCSETQVSDLSALQGLTQLTALNCSETRVGELSSVRELTQLTALRVSALTELPRMIE